MIAGGNHTTIHAGTALAVPERALSAPFGGTSPKGRGKHGYLFYRLVRLHIITQWCKLQEQPPQFELRWLRLLYERVGVLQGFCN